MWTFVHKVAISRFLGTTASAATAETCKRYFLEAWAKREKDRWGIFRKGDIMSESLEQNHRFGCGTGGVKRREEERQNSEACKDKATIRLVEQVNLQTERFVSTN